MERNICDNFTLRLRDEECDGPYSKLEIETNGSDPDYKPLPSEEMQWWTYNRASGALDIPSWNKKDLYLGQKQYNYVISTAGPLRPANAD